MHRILRYSAPNLVTALGMLFGLASLVATYEHRFVDAAWLIIWAVLVDKLDGFVARTLKATSAFGVQMDSFADAFNFGVAPAFLVYVQLSSVPQLGFGSGAGRVLLMAACAAWFLANVFRLAKFNVVADVPSPSGKSTFFGVPTTLAAGTFVIWILVLQKYGDPSLLGMPEAFRGPRLYDGLVVGAAGWAYLPAVMLLLALLMVSNVPTPKLGAFRWRWLNPVLLVLVLSGYVCGFARFMPDYMAIMPTTWLLCSLGWGLFSPEARLIRPPPFLPLDATDDEDEEVANEELGPPDEQLG